MPGDQYLLKPCGKHYGFNGDKCSLCSVARAVDGVLATDTYYIDNSQSNKKVIVKKEYDHIVGYSDRWDTIVYISEIKDHWSDGTSPGGIIPRFYFCPKKGCGKPIDWEAIEKQLNHNTTV